MKCGYLPQFELGLLLNMIEHSSLLVEGQLLHGVLQVDGPLCDDWLNWRWWWLVFIESCSQFSRLNCGVSVMVTVLLQENFGYHHRSWINKVSFGSLDW